MFSHILSEEENKLRKTWVKGCPDSNYAAQPKVLKAQQIILEAWSLANDNHQGRVEIAEKALKASNLCADAWCCLAEHKASTLGIYFYLFYLGAF